MNVLILTPDRVGSTLLQRILTVHMLNKGFDKPVVDLYDIGNGIEGSINETFGTFMLHKSPELDYFSQTLPELQEMLEEGMKNHYVVSRLSLLHLEQRNDSKAERLRFFEFLNKNFYIISCRRTSLFEHALSWMIHRHSKVTNVFTPTQKVNMFHDVYNTGITIHKEGFISVLNRYEKYLDLCETHFHIQSYFNYEDGMQDIEKYIHSLEFMKDSKTSWEDMFGIDFKTWNKCHKLIPDLKLKESNNTFVKSLPPIDLAKGIPKLDWDIAKGSDWPDEPHTDESLSEDIKNEILALANEKSVFKDSLPTSFPSKEVYDFAKHTIPKYLNVTVQLANAWQMGLLPSESLPIKLQTFEEKKELVTNFDECVAWFNEWAIETGLCDIINTTETLEEENMYHNFSLELPPAFDNCK